MRTLCGIILAAAIVATCAANSAPFNVRDFDANGFCKFYYKFATDGVFDGISFRHIRGKVREPSIFDDTPERPFKNLRFEDVLLEGETSSRVVKIRGEQ